MQPASRNQQGSATPAITTGRKSLLALGVACCLFLAPLQPLAQTSTSQEYRAKANSLANFTGFVDWPVSGFATRDSPFLLCIVGDFPFGTSLAERTSAMAYRGRRIQVVWVHKDSETSSCQILFVSRAEAQRYSKVLEAVRGRSVLTVGETPNFLDCGGAVAFSFQQETLQFEINRDALEEAHLKMSSRLLALARRVVGKTVGAKT